MEEKFEESHLDNILLDKEKNKLDKIKKIILLVASLALVFTISVVIMKVLNSDEESSDITKVLPTEPIAHREIKEPEPLFEQLPIDEEPKAEDTFDKIVKDIKLKAKEDMELAEAQIEQEISRAKELTTAEVMAGSNIVEPESIVSPVAIASEPTQIPKPTPIAVSKPKPVMTPEVPEVIERAKEPVDVKNVESGYYIQIGAFRNVQEPYLKDITKRGFTYRLKVINKSDGSSITKVLIGPYDSKVEAKEDLLKVKESVAKGAYLTKV